MLFVAPGERFELSFGHEDGVRVYRQVKRRSEVDEIDKWRHEETRTAVYLSNLEGMAKKIEVIERVPVSEIEHVRVTLDEAGCDPLPRRDDHGFCRFDIELAPNNHKVVNLSWRLSSAPEVEGL